MSPGSAGGGCFDDSRLDDEAKTGLAIPEDHASRRACDGTGTYAHVHIFPCFTQVVKGVLHGVPPQLASGLAEQAVIEMPDAAEAAIGERIDTTAGTSTADTLPIEATHSRRE